MVGESSDLYPPTESELLPRRARAHFFDFGFRGTPLPDKSPIIRRSERALPPTRRGVNVEGGSSCIGRGRFFPPFRPPIFAATNHSALGENMFLGRGQARINKAPTVAGNGL